MRYTADATGTILIYRPCRLVHILEMPPVHGLRPRPMMVFLCFLGSACGNCGTGVG